MKASNYLVTCIGAYQDSGIGTGGFVIYDGEHSHVIDTLDSTGLYFYEKKNWIFRYIRATKVLVVYDLNGIRLTINLPDVSDVHDLIVKENEIIVVSTGSNKVQWFNFFGDLQKEWYPGGTDDAWHLNCLWELNDALYLSAFGEFDEHRGWNGNSTMNGFILNLDTNQKVVTELSGPHHPRYFDGMWWICDSHDQSFKAYKEDKLIKNINLAGFTRGVVVQDDIIAVGVSANRKNKDVNNGSIKLLQRNSYQVLPQEISIPFPEIYDILEIDATWAAAIRNNISAFQLITETQAMANLRKQVEQSQEEVQNIKNKYFFFRKAYNSMRRIRKKITG